MVKKLEDVNVQNDTDRVVLLMRQLNVKQYEFAKELGYSKVYLESVINGRAPFTNSFRQRINEYLDKRIGESIKQ
ncbi:helix-turn-helix transcriptional regulator [Cytobacillus gottheilii]|uniref:helix-turn-helix transcriptional regulator n=1 Tax=Cytobacillus gottheilii TaxID=859144 RepID=UPI0024953FBB|nr:helix-turn-helix transcriptional regulator [Cytobacillus gottheilii]